MNEIQKKYYDLLCELDEICRENGIVYYLSGKTALCAYVKHEMPDVNTNPSIMISVKDCLRLLHAIENKRQPERIVESMESGGTYPSFNLKYTDTESLCLSVRQYRNYQVHGISVYINLIENVPNKYLKKAATLLKLGWRENTAPYGNMRSISKKGRLAKYILKPFYILNRRLTGKWIFRTLIKIYSRPSKRYQIRKNDGGIRTIPAVCVHSEPQKVRAEGHEFLVTGESVTYFKSIFGARYYEERKLTSEINKYRIIDASIPYKEYLENNKEFFQSTAFEKLICENNRLNRLNKENNDVINRAWLQGQYAGAKLRLEREYFQKKEKIKNLYESSAFDELRIELADYIEEVENFVKDGLVIYIDDELFDITLDILRETKSGKYIERLERLAVPYKKQRRQVICTM